MKSKRFVKIILLTLIISCIAVVVKQKCISQAITTQEFETYTVQSGDTLWSISKQYTHGDPRDLIYKIRYLNNITPDIRPGQKIKIPAKKV